VAGKVRPKSKAKPKKTGKSGTKPPRLVQLSGRSSIVTRSRAALSLTEAAPIAGTQVTFSSPIGISWSVVPPNWERERDAVLVRLLRLEDHFSPAAEARFGIGGNHPPPEAKMQPDGDVRRFGFDTARRLITQLHSSRPNFNEIGFLGRALYVVLLICAGIGGLIKVAEDIQFVLEHIHRWLSVLGFS
jgi:hypothetical protein